MVLFTAESTTLTVDGPTLEITIGLGEAAADARVKADEAVPTPVVASGLIDTGASITAVQQGVLAPLNLHPVGVVQINSPTSHNVPCALYAVRLTLPNGWVDVTVVETLLPGQNVQVLIGRDVLHYGLLVYNGLSGHFTLAF